MNQKKSASLWPALCLVTVLLVILKLTGALAWPWWAVLLPVLGPLGLIVAISFVVAVAVSAHGAVAGAR